MNKTQKQEHLSDLKDKLTKAQLAVFANYRGLSSEQANDFRKLMRTKDSEVKVVKNTVARLATKELGLDESAQGVTQSLDGPTMVAFVYGDPAAGAKAVFDFSKDNEALGLRDSLMDGKRVLSTEIEKLASLPSREAMLAIFLGVLNAPARDFVSVLAAVPRGFVTVLKAIADKKEESGNG